MNKVIKSITEHRQLPVDAIVMIFKQVQDIYYYDFKRGLTGFGNFKLKPEFEELKKSCAEVKLNKIRSMQDIVKNLLDGGKPTFSGVEKGPNFRLTQKAMASLCNEKGLIGFAGNTSTFTAMSPFGSNVHSVQYYPKPSKCSCPSTGRCYHLMAVQMALRDTESNIKCEEKYSLSLLLRKRRGNERKAGRKKPRPKDYNYDVDPAPDAKHPLDRKSLHHDFPATSNVSAKFGMNDGITVDNQDRSAAIVVPKDFKAPSSNTPVKVENDTISFQQSPTPNRPADEKSTTAYNLPLTVKVEKDNDVVTVHDQVMYFDCSSEQSLLHCSVENKNMFYESLRLPTVAIPVATSTPKKNNFQHHSLVPLEVSNDSLFCDSLPNLASKKSRLQNHTSNSTGDVNAKDILQEQSSSLVDDVDYDVERFAMHKSIADKCEYPWEQKNADFSWSSCSKKHLMQCLAGCNWLTDEAIETAINAIILSSSKKSESFLLWESYLLQLSMKNTHDEIAAHACRWEALNYDYFIFLINPGSHWYIAV